MPCDNFDTVKIEEHENDTDYLVLQIARYFGNVVFEIQCRNIALSFDGLRYFTHYGGHFPRGIVQSDNKTLSKISDLTDMLKTISLIPEEQDVYNEKYITDGVKKWITDDVPHHASAFIENNHTVRHIVYEYIPCGEVDPLITIKVGFSSTLSALYHIRQLRQLSFIGVIADVEENPKTESFTLAIKNDDDQLIRQEFDLTEEHVVIGGCYFQEMDYLYEKEDGIKVFAKTPLIGTAKIVTCTHRYRA